MRFFFSTILAATAVTALASTAAFAQPYPSGPQDHPPALDHQQVHGVPPAGPPQWHRGDHYAGDRYVVHDWQHYHLRQPPAGYQWVQSGGQFVLIAVASGVVADIILNSH